MLGQALRITFNNTPHERQLTMKRSYSILGSGLLNDSPIKFIMQSFQFFCHQFLVAAASSDPSRAQTVFYAPLFPCQHASSQTINLTINACLKYLILRDTLWRRRLEKPFQPPASHPYSHILIDAAETPPCAWPMQSGLVPKEPYQRHSAHQSDVALQVSPRRASRVASLCFFDSVSRFA